MGEEKLDAEGTARLASLLTSIRLARPEKASALRV
jgi:hypothetical protein